MAYQTNSGDFFDYLTQLLVENKVSEMVQILSDASSSDVTLNGDLKFLKLRANKKLMVLAGGVGKPPKTQIQDVIKLIKELKNAHFRRNVKVNTLTQPSKGAMKAIQKNNPSSSFSKKKRSVWPWIFLLLLLGGGAAGYYFKDQILQNEYVKKVIPEGFFSSNNSSELNKASAAPKKPKKKIPKKNNTNTTSSNKKVTKPSSTSIGKYFIQIASYSELDQAKSKRKRVAMSFDRAFILKKDLGGKPNYKIVIPGFATRENAEDFQDDRKVDKLYIGAFIQPFSSGCGNLFEMEKNIYVCK